MRQTGKRGSGQWEEISWAEAIKLISDKFKSAAHSDIWVPVRPDTDGAMLLAMCNYTIDNDLIDYDYLRNHSVALLLAKEDLNYLRLSDLGMDPLPAMKEGGDSVDNEAVYDSASQTFGSSFSATDSELEGSFDASGIAVRTVYSVAKEAIKDFAVEFAAKECDVPVGRLWSRSVRRRLTSTSSAPLPTEWASMACISQTKNICANTWTHPKTWKLAVATTL